VPTIQIKIKDGELIKKEVKYHHPLKQAIITTVSYFDIFSIPLKTEDIQKFLFRTSASEMDVLIILKRLQGEGLIQEKDNYWFLKGRQKIIKIHQKRTVVSEKKLKRAKFYAKLLGFVPFVGSVSVCNSLSYHNAKKSSDIDLFIITKKNRLWISRTLSHILFKILGIKRPRNVEKSPNKFCLSFFLSQDNLNLDRIYARPFDPYLSFWIAGLIPVFGFKSFKKFINKNIWYRQDLPGHFFSLKIKSEKGVVGYLRFILEKLLNLFGASQIDKWLYKWQAKRVLEEADSSEIGVGIIAKREILKTHAKDMRRKYREKLELRLKENLENI